MALIPLVAFWVVAIRLWVVHGPKTPAVCIALWLLALFASPALGQMGGLAFLVMEVALASFMIIAEKYKNAL
jgi:hypothetical protein